MLDENSCHLAVADVDVVRPLYLRRDAVLLQHIDHTQRHSLREQKLLLGSEKTRLQHQREGEVLFLGTLPRMATLTTPCRLALGDDDVALAVGGFYGLVVCR